MTDIMFLWIKKTCDMFILERNKIKMKKMGLSIEVKGYSHNEENFASLLKERYQDVLLLKLWIKQKNNWLK